MGCMQSPMKNGIGSKHPLPCRGSRSYVYNTWKFMEEHRASSQNRAAKPAAD